MGYLITGGAGFIGSHIAEKLVSVGKKVTIIDNLSTGRIENISSFKNKVNFIKGDILDRALLEKSIDEGDIVFHQAALASVSRSIEDPFSTNKVNVEGTLNVLLAARNKKAKRVIFSSSSSVYGDSLVLPKKEDMQTNPKSPYALSKLAGEVYMQLFFRLYGLETVTLRYFNVFGPRQDPGSEYSAVIPKFIKGMAGGKRPIIYGDGKQSRDFTYIENVVSANLLASESKKAAGEMMNVACRDRITLLELVNELNKKLKTNLTPVHEEERKGDVKHSQADIEKAGKLLGYKPKITFSEGLDLTIKSMRK